MEFVQLWMTPFLIVALFARSFYYENYGLKQSCLWAAVIYIFALAPEAALEYGHYYLGNLYYLALDASLILMLMYYHAPKGAWVSVYISAGIAVICIADKEGWVNRNRAWMQIIIDIVFMYCLTVYPGKRDRHWNDSLAV